MYGDGGLVGYAPVSANELGLAARRDALTMLGGNIYVDHGLTGTSRAAPGPVRYLAVMFNRCFYAG